MKFGTYNEYDFYVLVISIMILITSTILITSCTYNELPRGLFVNGTNTYNESPVYFEVYFSTWVDFVINPNEGSRLKNFH